jgi:2-keto-3-deoxy-6-phosphogluconate aldolase
MSELSTPATPITPYAAAKFVNAHLEEAGVSKPIPPQMMYNYTKARVTAGRKPAIAFTETGGVDPASLAEWTKAYVAKRVAKEVRPVADPEQAEFDASEAS